MIKKNKTILLASILLFFIVFALALMLGRYNIKLNVFFKAMLYDDNSIERSIILNLRLPRTLMATFVGIGLSLSGLLYQEIFRNDLVSPDLLGVSAGSSVGAALAIVLSLSAFLLVFFLLFLV